MKICSLYGAGYYYIPGTDTCIKVGGYVRVQLETGANAGGVPDIMGGTQGGQNRLTNGYGYRMRGNATWDVRSQTEYGTLRSYMSIQVQNTDVNTDAINTETAFIQWAGFTAGITNSFYDFHSFAPYGYMNLRANSNVGAAGQPLIAYTAQFGNGLSASIAAEDSVARRGLVIDTGVAIAGNTAATFSTAPTTDYAAQQMPDITANLRIDQAWGSAQVMGALHKVSAQYYGANSGTTNSAHPSDAMGWAVGAGLKLNIPGMPGDVFWLQGNYAKGATSYTFNNGTTIWNRFGGSSVGYGWVSDAVFGTAAANPSLDLTDSWSVTATYEHIWNKKWKTSVNGGYQAIDYSDAANTMICNNATVAGYGLSNCNNDFSAWTIGSRTEWTPVANLSIGLDVVYTKLNTASKGTSTAWLSTGAANGTQSIADQDVWSAAMRIQRNFYP